MAIPAVLLSLQQILWVSDPTGFIWFTKPVIHSRGNRVSKVSG